MATRYIVHFTSIFSGAAGVSTSVWEVTEQAFNLLKRDPEEANYAEFDLDYDKPVVQFYTLYSGEIDAEDAEERLEGEERIDFGPDPCIDCFGLDGLLESVKPGDTFETTFVSMSPRDE